MTKKVEGEQTDIDREDQQSQMDSFLTKRKVENADEELENVVEDDEDLNEEEEEEEDNDDEDSDEDDSEDDDEEESDDEEDEDSEGEEEDEEDDDDSTQVTLSALMDEIVSLRERINIGEGDKGATEEEEGSIIDRVISVVGVDDDDLFDEITSDRGKFNDFLKQYGQGIREEILRDIPTLVDRNIVRQNAYRAVITKFYGENPDLKPFASFVGHEVTKVEAEHPNWSSQKILEVGAINARKELKLKKKAKRVEDSVGKKKSKSNKPAFAKKPSGSRKRGSGKKTKSETQTQIGDMLSRGE